MLHTISTYWPYILPPLLGAVIGYVTNYIAIRMLFRPLRAWHLFGLRIPLTPGIIPSQRHKLANKMGQMVGSHLLTTADVAQALEKPQFRAKLHQAVAVKLDNFISRDLGPAITLLPQRFHNRFFELVEMLRWKLLKSAFKYLSTTQFQRNLERFCLEQLNQLLEHSLEHYLPEDRYQQARGNIEHQLRQWLRSDALSTSVTEFISTRGDKLIDSGKSLRDLLPPSLTDAVLLQLEQEMPALIQQFAQLLKDPEMRTQLEEKARQGIDSFIDSVEGLAAIISALFDMNKIYARLPQFIEHASSELELWLESEQVRADLSRTLRERVDHWLEQPLTTYVQQLPYKKVAAVKRFVSRRVLDFIHGDNCPQLILTWLDSAFGSIKDRPLMELVNQVGGSASNEKIARQISAKIVELVQSAQVQQGCDELLQQKIDHWINNRPVGNLSARLPSDAREDLYQGIFEQLLSILGKEVPPLVDSLDIHRIVEDKVNSLDILQVEELLMGIMKEQFKYINIFGALLGAVIGMLNILFIQP